MDFLGPVVQILLFFWDPVYRQICYLKDLNRNVATLTSEMEELKCKRDEIQADVADAVSVGKARVPAVDKWLVDVGDIEMGVDSIRSELDQRQPCLCIGCHCDHFRRYRLGKRVVKKINQVANLKGKALVFDKVAVSPRWPLVQEMQLPPQLAQQSTSEKMLEMIWQCLHEEEKGIICVYGMGGVGKTTLMQAINNKFIGTKEFDVVIWVTVSQELNLGAVQEKIGERLGLVFGHNESIDSRRDKLFPRLKNIKYMLILDDLWQTFSLDKAGIPKPDKQNRCKIAITTRSSQVGDEMDADILIRVKTLESDEAWKLFCDIAGDVVLSHDIQPLAEQVVRECDGLPLAIKTVGGAMRRKYKKVLWEDALRALRDAAPEIPSMERRVFLSLKLSYDSLEDPKLQLCFLYCSLYPEDWDIPRADLVTYWAMEEGLIENVKNLDEGLNKGHAILERLIDACLLEERSGLKECPIRMHDLLRDLAIWITCPTSSTTSSSSSSSINASKFLVKAAEGLMHPPEEKMWEGKRRVSLMGNKFEHLHVMPNCPDLATLFLGSNMRLRTIDDCFFECMPKLQILDLSDCLSLVSVPASISRLVNLHALILKGCFMLAEMPSLGQLKELKLLDLSYTRLIRSLPEGIGNLVKLKKLELSGSTLLPVIPSNLISSLTSLEYLGLLDPRRTLTPNMGAAILNEVVTLPHLTALTINLSYLDRITSHYFDHRKWSDLRRFIVIVQFGLGYWASATGDGEMFYLKDADKMIHIYNCKNFPLGIERLVRHADYLRLRRCRGLARFSQFRGDMKRLRCLKINGFYGLECFIDWREAQDDALECLEKLHLEDLPGLNRLFAGGDPLPRTRFQRLRVIEVSNCHKLMCVFSSNIVACLHQLEELRVHYCDLVEEIFQGDHVLPENPFPRLRSLSLSWLGNLSRLCSQQLIFTSLKYIYVKQCPKLKKLPLLSSSIQKVDGYIMGDNAHWWEGLEYEDDHSKSLYSQIYKEKLGFFEEEEDASEPEQKEEVKEE